jgi:hypothetical protein
MDQTLATFTALARLTLRDPAEGARRVKHLELPAGAAWLAFGLVVVTGVLLAEIAGMLLPAQGAMFEAFRQNPLYTGALQAVILFLTVHATHRIGAAFGGTGTFEQSLQLLVWLQFLVVGMQVLQIVVLLVFPPLSTLVGFAVLVWFLWVLTTFVMVLHGFESRGKVFAMIVVSFIVIVVVLSFVLAMLGVVVVPEGMTDV